MVRVFYHRFVGAGTYERELRHARIALIGAVRRLEQTMGAFEGSDVSLWPGPNGEFPQWTAEQEVIVKAAAAAWTDFVRRRQDYDSARRTAHRPAEWPHA
jgi:hypothetical protein